MAAEGGGSARGPGDGGTPEEDYDNDKPRTLKEAPAGPSGEAPKLSVLFYACGLPTSTTEVSFGLLRLCVSVFRWLLSAAGPVEEFLAHVAAKRMPKARACISTCQPTTVIEDTLPGAIALKNALDDAAAHRRAQLGLGSIVFKVFDCAAADARHETKGKGDESACVLS
jgi:hypothetical protein